jgi:putative transposase
VLVSPYVIRNVVGKDVAIKKLIAKSLEQILESELTGKLGCGKHSPAVKNTGNSRNGKAHKTLKNDNGEIEITVLRNRNSEFDHVIVKKYEMTTRDIRQHTYRMVISKAAYSCLGVDVNGRKDLLGLWVGEAEGANFWLSVYNLGVQDILVT